MRATILKLIVFLLILIATFVSCEQEAIEQEEVSECNCIPLETNQKPLPTENARLVRVLNYSNYAPNEPYNGEEYTYNNAGNLVRKSVFSCNPMFLIYYVEYEYSGDKLIRESTFKEYVDAEEFNWSFYYFYENEHLVRREYRRYDGSFASSNNYEYKNGNLIREYNYSPENNGGKIFDEVLYTYDNQNKLILTEYTMLHHTHYRYIKYIYDEYCREVKMEYYNTKWELVNYVEKIYADGSTFPQKELHYQANGVQFLGYRHFYDEWNNLIETRYFDGSLDGCTLFRRKYYGGLLMEEIHYAWDSFGGVIYTSCAEEVGVSRYEYEDF
jgi:hypothetical protein